MRESPSTSPLPPPSERPAPDHHLSPSPALRRYGDIRELIAGPANPTPLVRLNRVVPAGGPEIHLKLEWMNPFGSVKDRAARRMLAVLAETGALDGREIVEATSGNTGIALAALAALMGKRIKITIPAGVPEEKKVILRMLGAEVWATPDDLCPVDHPKDGAIALAHSFLKSADGPSRYAMPDQYQNPENVRAHYETTGPEIWRQTEGKLAFFAAGLGTCGTITGVGRFLKEMNPAVRVIAVEPEPGHRLPGMKNLTESKVPPILDRGVIDRTVRVNDHDAYAMTKRLFREEGLIVGPSTGAIVHAALQAEAPAGGIGVALSPDSGFKYASFFAGILGSEGIPDVSDSGAGI